MDCHSTNTQRRTRHSWHILRLIALLACIRIFCAAVDRSQARADDGKPKPATATTKAANDSVAASTFELHIVGPDGKPVPNAKIDVRSTPRLQAEQVRIGKFERKGRYGVDITADANGRILFVRPAGLQWFDILIEIPGYAPYWAA